MKKKRKHPVKELILPIGPSIAYVPLTRGMYALIDMEDAGWIGQSNWYAKKCYRAGNYYAQRHTEGDGGKDLILTMHRAILRPRDGFMSDHVFGNTLDNRRSVLREATQSQNAKNTKLFSTNTSGFKGVSWNKAQRKFHACTMFNGKRIHRGFFDTAEEANEAVRSVRAELYGEFERVA